ncbi:MAG: GDP-mannose 4,6-dehydratase [Verrucomicrobiota bacterium JB022]|nr:GDP-mannose 4,6-dehydratase [Verrucomicrobiota bacterium JB022]
MSRYLVTGCAGFIGWKTAELLLADGHEVVGVDDFNAYYDQRLKTWRLQQLQRFPGFTCHEGDICDEGLIAKAFAQGPFEAVFHLAARAGVRYSMEAPKLYFEVNTLGLLTVLDAMRQSSGPRKIVIASTSSLYAGLPMPFTEDLPVNTPISPYAASKKAAEALAYSYHHLYGFDISVTRFFTVYGPAGRPDMSPLRFCHWIYHGTPLTIYGDGLQTRDFTYVDDIARGTVAASRPLGYEVINLGGGNEPVSLMDMIRVFEDVLGRKATLKHEPVNASDMRHTHADISKARRLLDWEPVVAPEEGFRLTAQWYLDNLTWLSDLKL